MGPHEKMTRETIIPMWDVLAQAAQIGPDTPRMAVLAIGGMMVAYMEALEEGRVTDETAEDYLNSIYALLGEHESRRIRQ